MVPLIDTRNTHDSETILGENLPTGVEKVAMVRDMFDRIASRYDFMNRLISLGLDQRWRFLAIGALSVVPRSTILDLGAGTANFARALRERNYRTAAVDLSYRMLAASKDDHGPLCQADAACLPFLDGAFDGVVSGFALRNFADLETILCEAHRVLRAGGRLSLLEVDTPSSPLIRAGHHVWFNMVVPRLGGLFSDGAAYRYLPRSVAYLPDPDGLRAHLEKAGFVEIERRRLYGGLAQIVTATRSGNYGTRVEGTDET